MSPEQSDPKTPQTVSSNGDNLSNGPGTSAQTVVVEPQVSPQTEEVQPAPATPTPQPPAPTSTTPQTAPGMPTAATGDSVVGGSTPGGVSTGMGGGWLGRKRLLVAGVAVFLLLAIFGYVFAFYIPNKPENVWKSAMTNGGKAYDMVTEYVTKDNDAKGFKVDGSYKVSGDVVADGSFTGKSNGSDSQVTGNFSVSGLKLGFDLRTLKAAGGSADLYFKFTGLEGLGALLGGGNPEVTSMFNGFNNQWFVIDHTLLQQYGGSATGAQFSRADLDNFFKALGTPSKEYLFTSDAQKAVLEVKSIVGAEQKDGRNTYHYKVTTNQAHLKQYVQALCDSLKSDKLGKQLLQVQGGGDCKALADQIKSDTKSDTLDMWVDKRTKLIHVVRFSDTANAKNYAEISQDYQGGSNLPVGLSFHTDESGSVTVVNLKAVLDMDANTVAADGSLKLTGNTNMSGTFKLNIAPSNDTNLKVTKPANAQNFLQMLNSLGFGQMLGVSANANPASSYTATLQNSGTVVKKNL